MTTLRQLEYLVAVDDERHFGRAADRVHVAQPTLSAQLSTLEHRLNTRLFDRSRKGVSPPRQGKKSSPARAKSCPMWKNWKSLPSRSTTP